MKVKNSAIPYTAYDYQTLQGVKLLTAWLNSPMEFDRMCFEADAEDNSAPQGIDDVICQRADGKTDFWQVKFTPSPEKEENQLTWDWLLIRSGKTDRSRSILKKLSDAVASVPVEKLGRVILLTNKIPDRSMESCLIGERIDFLKITPEAKQTIIKQLGDEEKACSLFSILEIRHSDGDYQVLYRTVKSELYRHSNGVGVERLLDRSRQWAMFKDNPSPNGWIYLHHVREILSSRRPEPIPEVFTISPQYFLPDELFHEKLLNRISESKGEIITITGKPGLGKSTYLSYLCQALEEKGIPLIRHHYFLSLGDTTEDRLSPRVVAESFLHQIQGFHGEAGADTSQPEKLRNAIEQCARHYQQTNKPFVVLIDGLDHVWRDNARNKKPLDEIFRQLLPLLDNVVLLIGTQPVDNNLLPELLLKCLPKKDWLWLPAMTGNAIFEFLKYQVNSGRIQSSKYEAHVEEELQSCANKLLEISSGYPLHVIYSYEFLAQNGKRLSTWEIEQLPPCSDTTIDTYYQGLWSKLSYPQQDVLHLCCGFEFAWPRSSISLVLEDSRDLPPSVNAVSHMLFEGTVGVRPFHESLVVFVRNQPEHQVQVEKLLPKVCGWLRDAAPICLKDAWLWSCIARSGNSLPLRNGLSRDWLLDRLVEGMPVKTVIRLLSEAETYAFKELKFSEAYKHRELKTRCFNGPQFQTWNLPQLEILALINASQSTIEQEIDVQSEATPQKLAQMAIILWYRNDNERSAAINKKAIFHYRAKIKLLSEQQRQEENEALLVIKAGVLTDTLNYNKIFEEEIFSNWPASYIKVFIEACLVKKDIDLLFRAHESLALYEPFEYHRFLELALIRLSILEDFDLKGHPKYVLFNSQKLSTIICALVGEKNLHVEIHPATVESSRLIEVNDGSFYHDWFFASLATRLHALGDFSWIPIHALQKSIEETDVSIHLHCLNKLAEIVAIKIIEDGEIAFDDMCNIFPSEPLLDQTHPEVRRADILLKKTWIEISADCHLLTTKRPIASSTLKSTLDHDVINSNLLRFWYEKLDLQLLTDDAAQLLINIELINQSNKLEETIKYSNCYLDLAKIAQNHGEKDLTLKSLRLTWDFVLGYGHHKDSTIFDVITAIEYISSVKPREALDFLERISPIIFNISEFTDGDETRHSNSMLFSLLASLSPQTIASIYDYLLRDGEWYYAGNALSALIEKADFSLPIVKQIFLTGLEQDCYKTLKNLVDSGSDCAIEIKKDVENFLGINIDEEVVRDKYSSPTSFEEINLKPENYPPSDLDNLIKDLDGKYSTRDFWISWYDYWVISDQESNLLNILLPVVSNISDSLDDKRYLFDRLFISKKKLSGKTKAFDLIVAAHNAMSGWSRWHERTTNTLERLKRVATIYPERVDEFIVLTTEQRENWRNQYEKLIIPDDKLVFLLVESGRINEALELIVGMIESLEASVRNLKLSKPSWDWKNNDTLEEALKKSLVSRLKIPVPSIKLWVIEQVCKSLLQLDSKIEDLILSDLNSRQQESEFIEVLSLLLSAKNKGYQPPINLGNYIKARSVLSDMILNDFSYKESNFGAYAYKLRPIFNLSFDNNKFEYFCGTHFPQIYIDLLQDEENNTNIPWTKFLKSEWNNTFVYCPISGSDTSYFINGYRNKKTGQFYTKASHRGRSAFLRTIEIAKQYFGMPLSYAERIATQALPIEPAYIGLTPKRPQWLPKWSNNQMPTEQSIREYINLSLKEYSLKDRIGDLSALSMPIKVNENTWIDLTLVLVVTNEFIPSEFTIYERSKLICIGNKLEPYLSYQYNDYYKENLSYARQLVATSYPLLRYGHWCSDLETRGLYIPLVQGRNVLARSDNGFLNFEIGDLKIGYSSYWYNYWQPSHPKQLRSLCGTFTVLDKDNYPKWLPKVSKNAHYFYSCKAIVISAKESYSDFETSEINFLLTIE